MPEVHVQIWELKTRQGRLTGGILGMPSSMACSFDQFGWAANSLEHDVSLDRRALDKARRNAACPLMWNWWAEEILSQGVRHGMKLVPCAIGWHHQAVGMMPSAPSSLPLLSFSKPDHEPGGHSQILQLVCRRWQRWVFARSQGSPLQAQHSRTF